MKRLDGRSTVTQNISSKRSFSLGNAKSKTKLNSCSQKRTSTPTTEHKKVNVGAKKLTKTELKSKPALKPAKLNDENKPKRNYLEGHAMKELNGSCRLEGTFKRSKLHGDDCIFWYPDGSSIRGTAKCGIFTECHYYSTTGKQLRKVKIDHMRPDQMPRYLKDPDPYEIKTIEIRSVKGKGEGMFAKRNIKHGELCALYAGLLIKHYKVDKRRWEENSNTIQHNDTYTIDIPLPYSSLKVYNSTLGHKANHNFKPNAEFVKFKHPKFGDMMCLEAIADIKKGQQIEVDYGYMGKNGGPLWFKELKREKKRLRKLDEEDEGSD